MLNIRLREIFLYIICPGYISSIHKLSPSQKYLAVANNGQRVQTLQLIDVTNENFLDSFIIA